MAGNDGCIVDEDGNFSDWIELGNAGDEPVSLEGWYLSDKQDEPNRWQLPAVTLEPGEYLLVFASGKNRQEGELHTDFSLVSGGDGISGHPGGAVLAGVETQDLPDGQSLAGDGAGPTGDGVPHARISQYGGGV